jgi:hypothetical protein
MGGELASCLDFLLVAAAATASTQMVLGAAELLGAARRKNIIRKLMSKMKSQMQIKHTHTSNRQHRKAVGGVIKIKAEFSLNNLRIDPPFAVTTSS